MCVDDGNDGFGLRAAAVCVCVCVCVDMNIGDLSLGRGCGVLWCSVVLLLQILQGVGNQHVGGGAGVLLRPPTALDPFSMGG